MLPWLQTKIRKTNEQSLTYLKTDNRGTADCGRTDKGDYYWPSHGKPGDPK